MTSTLQLTPAAAARMFEGPRYRPQRSRLTPQRARQALHCLAEQFKMSHNGWIVAFGDRIQSWLNLKPQRA